MKRDEIFIQVTTILAELFEIPAEEITMDSKLYEELDLDSIDAVDLVVQLKNTLQKDIEPNIFRKVRTVRDVVDVIESLS